MRSRPVNASGTDSFAWGTCFNCYKTDGLSEKLRRFRALIHAAQRVIAEGPKPAKEGPCQELLASSGVQAHSNSFQSILHQSLAYPGARQGESYVQCNDVLELNIGICVSGKTKL